MESIAKSIPKCVVCYGQMIACESPTISSGIINLSPHIVFVVVSSYHNFVAPCNGIHHHSHKIWKPLVQHGWEFSPTSGQGIANGKSRVGTNTTKAKQTPSSCTRKLGFIMEECEGNSVPTLRSRIENCTHGSILGLKHEETGHRLWDSSVHFQKGLRVHDGIPSPAYSACTSECRKGEPCQNPVLKIFR